MIAIDAAVTFQRMDGFGITSRAFDDPHLFNNFDPATGRAITVLTSAQQDATLDCLFVDLKLIRLRPASPDTAVGAGSEPANDDRDPYVTNLGGFNFA